MLHREGSAHAIGGGTEARGQPARLGGRGEHGGSLAPLEEGAPERAAQSIYELRADSDLGRPEFERHRARGGLRDGELLTRGAVIHRRRDQFVDRQRHGPVDAAAAELDAFARSRCDQVIPRTSEPGSDRDRDGPRKIGRASCMARV